MTKQQQRDDFKKEFMREDGVWVTEPRSVEAFWLQKQDQLLTELGESLEKEKHEWDSDNDDDFYFDAGIDKALFLINKYK